MESSSHYDAAYFAWQRPWGDFGGWANSSKFQPYISPADVVLDFGCGGGFILDNLACKRKLGVEINPASRAHAISKGHEVYASPEAVPNECADVLISNTVLEHTMHPLMELRELFKKLKPGGRAVFVVPCEVISFAWNPNDINQHLYSWSPLSIGNLFQQAGFRVIHAKPYMHKWRASFHWIAKLGGRRLFDLAAHVYARLDRRQFHQIHVLAEKPHAMSVTTSIR